LIVGVLLIAVGWLVQRNEGERQDLPTPADDVARADTRS
jgi:hypothetical protein